MRQILIAVATVSAFTGAAYAQTPAPTAAPARPAAAAVAVQLPQDAVIADQLDDLEIRNAANENVGGIEDIVLSQGRVVGYIISVGGFLGVGDRNILVDPSVVTVSYNGNDKEWSAVMNTTKEQLQAMPEFKHEERWRD